MAWFHRAIGYAFRVPFEPVEYRPSRTGMVVLSALALLLVVGDVWMLARAGRKPDDIAYAVGGLFVFGPAFVATLFPIFRPCAVLRLDTDGISECGHFGAENLNLRWSNVQRVEPFRWRVVPMLALLPIDEALALADGPESMRKAAKGNRRVYGHSFVIDARMYRLKTADLQAEIDRRIAAAPPGPVAYPRSSHGLP